MTDTANETPQAKKGNRWSKVAVIVVCVFAILIWRLNHHIGRGPAMYQDAKSGGSIVEVLEKHPGWWMIRFHGDNCGYINKTSDGKIKIFRFPLQSEGAPIIYPNVRKFFQAHPAVFVTCPSLYVRYNIFLFNDSVVDLRVDADGRIVDVKEPYNSD